MAEATDAEKNDDEPNSLSKQAWPILAIGLTVAGLLTWLAWAVSRPEEMPRERR